MRQPVLPNFFVVGAGKAGTTSLHRYLKQHPQIYMSPVKEPSYFASEIRPADISREMARRIRVQSKSLPRHIRDGKPFNPMGWLACNWADYLRLFQEVNGETAIGEASPAYLWSATAAANIRAAVPHAKIVIMLRDPAERAFSQYLHQLSVGLTRTTFRRHLERCSVDGHKELGIYYPFLEIGSYHDQVKRFIDTFPRNQIRIYWYEQAWQQPAKLMADLFQFLGVDAAFQPDTAERSHQRRAPRWATASYALRKVGAWRLLRSVLPGPLRQRVRGVVFQPAKSLVMQPPDRRYLVDYYREDIGRLATLLDRDLSAWLC